jgi:hypothetical protein
MNPQDTAKNIISMEQKDIQQVIKDTVLHAKNAFFSEDSRMADHILKKMEGHITKAIDDRLEVKLIPVFEYIKDDTTRNKQKDEADIAFKKDIMPVIEMGKNVQGFGKVSLYILGFIASLSAGFYALMAFLKKN